MAGEARPSPDRAAASAAPRLVGAFRLVHPFPSILDGVVVALIALVASASPSVALRVGLSMTLLQFSIGALNDVVDAPRDAGHKPGKPIPVGFVTLATARVVVIATAVGGLVLAAVSGPGLLALGVVVLGIGFGYDLVAKGTALSWVPFAAGIPLLPVYGWYGATDGLPVVFLVLVPAAALAGAGLAIANAVVDVERDHAAGATSVARRLGARRAAAIVLAIEAAVALLAVGTASAAGTPTGWVVAVALAAGVPLAGAALGLAGTMDGAARLREVAWEVQAIGTGLLAVAWLGGLSAAGGI